MKRLLTSCLGLGWLPVAPGTWGSLPPALVFGLMAWRGATPAALLVGQAVLLVFAAAVCVWCTPAVARITGKGDPGEVVVDEVAGQAVTFSLAALACPEPLSGAPIAWITAIGFLLFRLFDITKPWPCRRLERLPAGWGVLADDLMAGVYGGAILWAALTLVGWDRGADVGTLEAGLSWPVALLLGAFQGVTEFLPVSSSGHLVLLETLFGFNPEEPQMLLFDLATHTGTILAILVVLRASLLAFWGGIRRDLGHPSRWLQAYRRNPSLRLLVLAVVATGVTGAVGLSLKSFFVAARGNLGLVAASWIFTSVLLLLTEQRRSARTGLRAFGLAGAVIVGLAQAAAVLPGISRSGSTICAAILICGLRRRWAVEFGLILAVPTVLAATLLESLTTFRALEGQAVAWGPILGGCLMAFLVGIPAMQLLMRAFRKSRLRPFSLYCAALALFTFLLWGCGLGTHG
jgi:undecaprenyl-diphosphatase